MSTHARAIVALVKIMETRKTLLRRRIDACASLLDFECPEEINEKAKLFLTRVFEDVEGVSVDDRLMALKLMRRVSAAKITQSTVRSSDNDKNRDIFRQIEIAGRRARLIKAGLWGKNIPKNWADDLLNNDYVAPVDRSFDDVFEGK